MALTVISFTKMGSINKAWPAFGETLHRNTLQVAVCLKITLDAVRRCEMVMSLHLEMRAIKGGPIVLFGYQTVAEQHSPFLQVPVSYIDMHGCIVTHVNMIPSNVECCLQCWMAHCDVA